MKIDEISFPLFDKSVKVWVMTPDGYDGITHYPVLYMNDGQDVFQDKHVIWGEESLRFEAYYQSYKKFLPNIMIVAVECPAEREDRTAQYCPYSNHNSSQLDEELSEGGGIAYLNWIVNDLKPAIDSRYSTCTAPEYTAMGGYSTGGLFAIYAGLSRPDVFGRLLVMSPAAFRWKRQLQEDTAKAELHRLKYLYLDVGTNESGRLTSKTEFLQGTQAVYENLLQYGMSADLIKYEIFKDAEHTQSAWRTRFPDALRWVFQDC